MADSPEPRIKVVEDGPYRVTGMVRLVRMRPIKDEEGDKVEWEQVAEIAHEEAFELCRCGQSTTKPFCDRTEEKIAFDGAETADRGGTAERREQYGRGPVFVVTDDVSLCSSAAFCHRGDTDVWSLAEQTSDPERRALLNEMVSRCPSGRLVLHRLPDGDPMEPDLAPEIGVVDDGPLWLRGGVPVEAADGFEYEVRNRATLCRCGLSSNKPFCDSSHIRARFKDP